MVTSYDHAHGPGTDVLLLSSQNLPQHVKLALEDPASCYNNGWSHGKETLQNGKRDTHKGSFYANPAHNDVEESPALRQTFPEFYTSNMWPEEVPELQVRTWWHQNVGAWAQMASPSHVDAHYAHWLAAGCGHIAFAKA